MEKYLIYHTELLNLQQKLAAYSIQVQEKLFAVHSVKTVSCSPYCDRTDISFQLFNSCFCSEFSRCSKCIWLKPHDQRRGGGKKYLNNNWFCEYSDFL